MDGELPKSAPKIVNVRSAVALILGFVFLILANTEIIFTRTADHVDGQKSLFLHLLQEVGFALIVALVIWAMWEYFSQVETEDQWDARIERVAKSVFFSVFKRNFPDELIREANLLLLEQSFIRTGGNHLYTLRDDSFSRADGTAVPCVIVEAVVRFKVKNISNELRSYPLKVALPNPLHDQVKERCGVRRVQVRSGTGELVDQCLDKAEISFRAELADNSKHQASFELASVEIRAGQEIEVIWNYAMMKEEEDTEVVLFTLPTEGIVATVVDYGPSKRTVRAKSIHRCPLEDVSSSPPNGTYTFRLDKYLLTRQGFVIWWKRDVSTSRTLCTPEQRVAPASQPV
jgi:hypothetical protein